MIEFFTFAPIRLNLNGDQANMLVLRKRLEWLGYESKLTILDSLADVTEFSKRFEDSSKEKFLLLGHGSRAAMASFEPVAAEIRSTVLEMASNGLVGLAVGSSYELLQPSFKRVSRNSDYADIAPIDGLPRLFGYVNSDTDLKPVSRLGQNFVGSLVHGPLLARSPELADYFLNLLGVQTKANARSKEVDAFAEGASKH